MLVLRIKWKCTVCSLTAGARHVGVTIADSIRRYCLGCAFFGGSATRCGMSLPAAADAAAALRVHVVYCDCAALRPEAPLVFELPVGATVADLKRVLAAARPDRAATPAYVRLFGFAKCRYLSRDSQALADVLEAGGGGLTLYWASKLMDFQEDPQRYILACDEAAGAFGAAAAHARTCLFLSLCARGRALWASRGAVIWRRAPPAFVHLIDLI